ncbi:MAG: hypothetical protein J1F69_04270 [Clostridiales bacterium]|nr:hypothetical protein [Clostridiales bacterium]
MNKQMTTQDIIRLGKECGFEYSKAECERMQAHIRKQLISFELLNNVNTDGIDPTFDLAGEGRFKMDRWGE